MSMTDLLDDNMPDFKFNEDIYIDEIADYIISTYSQHYSKKKFQASEFNQSIYQPPGREHDASGSRKTLLNGVDFPLHNFDQLNLSKVTNIEILFDLSDTGEVQLNDMFVQKTAALRTQ